MAGRGRTISDAEKKARGTFRADESEAAQKAAREAKVITGVFLTKIPKPDFKLGALGKRKYDEITRILFEGNKLTTVTVMRASLAARMYEKIEILAEKGEFPSASDLTQLQRALDALKIAEDAPPIASPGQTNKFAISGFALRRRTKAV